MLTEQIGLESPVGQDLREITAAAERAAALTRQLLAFSRKQVLQPRILDLNAVITNLKSILMRLIGEEIELVLELEPTLGQINADPGQIPLAGAVDVRDEDVAPALEGTTPGLAIATGLPHPTPMTAKTSATPKSLCPTSASICLPTMLALSY